MPLRYENNGLSLELEEVLVVKSDAPNFLAITSDGTRSVVAEVDPEQQRREALEELFTSPLGTNPVLESRELNVASPENMTVLSQRCVEHSHAAKILNSGWGLNVIIDGTFIHVQLSSPGAFDKNESDWRAILASMRFLSKRQIGDD